MPQVRINTGMTPSTPIGVIVTFLNTCGHISNGGVHVEPDHLLITSLEALDLVVEEHGNNRVRTILGR